MTRRYGSGQTPRHQIRIPDDMWQRIEALAEREGVNASEIVRRAVGHYLEQHTS